MKKINFNLVLWGLFYVFIGSILIQNSLRYLDADYGWHYQVGKEIIEQKAVPSENLHSFSLSDKTWVDHEYLSNAVIYLIHSKLGYISLNIFFALLFLSVLIIQNLYIHKYFLKSKKAPVIIMAVQVFGVLAMKPHIGVRVQELTMLFTLIELILIHRYTINKNIKELLWLIPLFILWANTHAGFILAFCILMMWVVVKVFENLVSNVKAFNFLAKNERVNYKNILNFFFVSILAGVSTILTPYGFELFLFLKEYFSDGYYLTHVNEWLPFYAWPIQYLQLTYSATLIASIIFLFGFSKYYASISKENKSYRLSIWYLSLSLLFILFAMKSRRHFPILFIVSAPLMINFFANFFYYSSLSIKKIFRGSIIKFYIVVVFVLASALLFVNTNFSNDPFNNDLFCNYVPCEATQYLKDNAEFHDSRIFNNYGWGGYIIGVWPEKELFIDGRLPQVEFNGHSILEEYYEIQEENEVEKRLDKWEFDSVLHSKRRKIKLNWVDKYLAGFNEEEMNSGKDYLMKFLEGSDKWELRYEDNISVIYKRK